MSTATLSETTTPVVHQELEATPSIDIHTNLFMPSLGLFGLSGIDVIWRALFVENAPVSEISRGLVSVLKAFNPPTHSANLPEARTRA